MTTEAYLVPWERATASDNLLQDLRDFAGRSDDSSRRVGDEWIKVIALPWWDGMWDSARTASAYYQKIRVQLPDAQRQSADELFAQLFVRADADRAGRRSLRNDLDLDADAEAGDILTISPEHLSQIAQQFDHLDYTVLFKAGMAVEADDPNVTFWFEQYLKDWAQVIGRAVADADHGLVIV